MADVNIKMKDVPSKLHAVWAGYLHYMEKTLIPSNVLTFPTKNCFMPNRDKVITRLGSEVLGAEATGDFRIWGNHKKFSTVTGQDYEIRVFNDTDLDGLRFQALWTDPDTGIPQWVQFTTGVNTEAAYPDIDGGGQHVYFAEWYDNTAFKGRLIWTTEGLIDSWSGGITRVVSLTGTTITTDASWISKGFDGDGFPVRYPGGGTHTIASGASTDTITVDSTAGLSVGDIIVDGIQIVDPTDTGGPSVVHFCKTIKNHVLYGNFYSRQVWGSNVSNVPSTSETVQTSSPVLDDFIITDGGSYSGSTVIYLRYMIATAGTPDQYTVYGSSTINGSYTLLTPVPVDVTTPFVFNGVTLEVSNSTGHTVGDYWIVKLTPEVTDGYGDFTQNSPRLPGQAFTFYLPSNFFTMDIQEDVMYLNDAAGNWSYLELILSADLLTESVILQPLKQTTSSRAIFPYMVGHFDNYICYVTEEKTLDLIGRKKFLQLPQIGYLSDPIKLDFLRCSFVGGGFEFWDKKLFITSPNDLVMLCYDNVRRYWQPPQEFPEAGILSIVGASLIAHSHVRNQTNTLFTGLNDNGLKFMVKIRTGAYAYGNRWKSKKASMTFVDFYAHVLPHIQYSVLYGQDGCQGIVSHEIKPPAKGTCVPPDDGHIGGGSTGSVPIGGSATPTPAFMQEVWADSKLLQYDWFFAALDLECESQDQSWAVVSMGLNAVSSPSRNAELINRDLTLLAN